MFSSECDLLDAVDHGVALQPGDAPVVLLLVGQLDAVALAARSAAADPSRDAGSSRCRARFSPRARTLEARCPSTSSPPRCPARRAGGPPRGRRLRRDRAARLAHDRLGAPPAPIEIDGTPVNYVDIGSRATREPIVFVHGLGGQWQNWLENMPRAAQERRVIAARPARLRPVADAARRDHDLRLRARRSTRSATGSGSAAWTSSATRWAATSAAEVAIQFPQRVDQLLLVSAAGITSADLAHAPIMTAGPRGQPRSPPTPRPQTASSRRGRSRATWRSRWWRATRRG